MAFNTYEELVAAVESRRKSILTIEIDMGTTYSQEYEDAKKALAEAKGMKAMMGGAQFLGDNLEALEQRVAETKPPANSVWAQYRKLDLGRWAQIIAKPGQSAVDQYESVLAETFVGVYGADPVDENGDPVEGVEPLSTDGALLSSKGVKGILPGGGLLQVVQAFMSWQNTGGDVNIRPTKSGLV